MGVSGRGKIVRDPSKWGVPQWFRKKVRSGKLEFCFSYQVSKTFRDSKYCFKAHLDISNSRYKPDFSANFRLLHYFVSDLAENLHSRPKFCVHFRNHTFACTRAIFGFQFWILDSKNKFESKNLSKINSDLVFEFYMKTRPRPPTIKWNTLVSAGNQNPLKSMILATKIEFPEEIVFQVKLMALE